MWLRCPEGWISIHAPAWGATVKQFSTVNHVFISIHAPAWGATGRTGRNSLERAISIHAPAWGATLIFQKFFHLTGRFQSTLPHGERLTLYGVFLSDIKFQSTLPHGERRQAVQHGKSCFYFNPRSRMGSDGLLPHKF